MVMKIKKEQYPEVYEKKLAGASLKELAKEYGGEYGISPARISQICKLVKEQKEAELNANSSN